MEQVEAKEYGATIEAVDNNKSSDVYYNALEWFNLGLNVLPTKNKIPLVNSWKVWQTQRQTLADIQNMNWNDADRLAVICGTETTITHNGETKSVYFGAIDVDHCYELESIFKASLPDTYVERTNGGFHLYFWSECPVERIKLQSNTELGFKGFELLGEGSYTCIYNNPIGSVKSPADIEVHFDLTVEYKQLAKKLGLSKTPQMQKSVTHKGTKLELDMLLHTVVEEGNRDNHAFDLARRMRRLGYLQENALIKLEDWNLQYCRPSLEQSVIEAKIKSAYNYSDPEREEKFNRIEERDRLYQKFMAENHFLTMPNGVTYLYVNGIYVEDAIKPFIESETEKAFGKYYSKTDAVAIENRIQASTYVDSSYNLTEQAPLNLLCVENGILNMDTLELKPHDPSIHFFNKIPIKYDPNAQCPAVDKAMREWLISEEQFNGMYELFGYCLDRHYKHQYAFFWLGTSGSNGKGICSGLLRTFIGEKNTSDLPLSQMGENFKIVGLYGKLLNVADELNQHALEDTSVFKKVTGESTIEGYIKQVQKPIVFRNHAKLVVICNELPPVTDKTTAFMRRPIIFEFLNRFTVENGKKDPDLLAKLTTPQELSGLLNKALEARKRLHTNGKFSNHPANEEETAIKWEEDIIRDLLEEQYEQGGIDDIIALDKITQHCRDMLKEQESKLTVDNQTVGSKISKLFNCRSKQQGKGDNRKRYIYGIKLKGSENKKGNTSVDSYR